MYEIFQKRDVPWNQKTLYQFSNKQEGEWVLLSWKSWLLTCQSPLKTKFTAINHMIIYRLAKINDHKKIKAKKRKVLCRHSLFLLSLSLSLSLYLGSTIQSTKTKCEITNLTKITFYMTFVICRLSLLLFCTF